MSVALAVPGPVQRLALRLDGRVDASNGALWLTAFIPILALYLVTLRVNGADMISDTVSVTASAWQLAHHGTPRLPVGTPNWDAWMIPSGSGHVISNREPGLVFLAAIFYAVFPSASIFNVAPASLAAALVTAAAVATFAVIARRLVSARAALAAALIAGTATTTWAVSGTSLWPHGPDQLYLFAAVLALSARRFGWAGAALALGVFTRPPIAAIAAVMGVWFAWRDRSVRPLLAIGLPSVAGLAGFLTYSSVFWGGGLQSQYTSAAAVTGQGDGDMLGTLFDFSPHGFYQLAFNLFGAAISPGRGVLFGAPFIVPLAFGIRAGWRSAPSWVRCAAVCGVVYLLVEFKSNRFSGGAPFWSYRYPLEGLTLLAPLLLLAWREHVAQSARRRAIFSALVIFSIALQAVGAICFRSRSGSGTVAWLFIDLNDAIHERPMASLFILLSGYIAAAVAYRKLAYRQGERLPS